MKYLMTVLKHLKRLKWHLLIATVLCALASLFKTFYAIKMSEFLDKITVQIFSVNTLVIACVLLIIHVITYNVSERMFGTLMLRGGYAINDLNTNVLLKLSLQNKFSTGDIIERIGRDSGDLKNSLSSLLRASLTTCITVSVMLVILCRICWPLALITFALPIIYNLCVMKFSSGKQQEQHLERTCMSKLADYIEDRLINRVEIRLGGLEKVSNVMHQKLLNDWNDVRKTLSKFWSLVGACDSFLYLFYRLIILLFGIVFVKHGLLSYGEIFTFLVLSSTFMNFVWDFQAEAYRNSIAAAKKVVDFWDLPHERMDGIRFEWNNISVPIQISNTSFSYVSECVLDNISLDVRKGEIVGIVGESGCGKTTLLNLLCGFLNAGRGFIYIGGHLLSEWKLDAMREHLAYMHQNTSLIRGSLFENISFIEHEAISGVEQQKIIQILADVGLSYLINKDNCNIKRLGNLSQGELQRIGFARCLYKDAKVWILDEPTSALDEVNELEILELIKKFKSKGITMLVVTHRLNIVSAFDRIITLK